MSVDAAGAHGRRLIQWGGGSLAGLLALELLTIGSLTSLSLASWMWLGIYRGVVFHVVLAVALAFASVFDVRGHIWFAALGAGLGVLLSAPVVFYAGKLASDSLSAIALTADPLAGALAGYLWASYAKRLGQPAQ